MEKYFDSGFFELDVLDFDVEDFIDPVVEILERGTFTLFSAFVFGIESDFIFGHGICLRSNK